MSQSPNTSAIYANVTIPNGGYIAQPYTWTDIGVNASTRIDLKGPDADISINGESLTQTLKILQETLCVPGHLQRNHQLEQEFQELKELGQLYQQREQEYLEKRRMWNILKTSDQ